MLDLIYILINIDYNFLSKHIKFNSVKLDNKEVDDEFLTIIEEFGYNNVNNLTRSRRLINKLFDVYEG